MDHPDLTVSNFMEISIGLERVNMHLAMDKMLYHSKNGIFFILNNLNFILSNIAQVNHRWQMDRNSNRKHIKWHHKLKQNWWRV